MKYSTKGIDNMIDEVLSMKETIREHFAIDGEMLVGISYAKITGAKVFVHGWFDCFEYFERVFREIYGIIISGIIVDNKADIEISDLDIRIYTESEFANINRNKEKYVVFFSELYSGKRQIIRKRALIAMCRRASVSKYFFMDEEVRRRLTNVTHDWIDSNRSEYYRQSKNQIKEFAYSLADKESVDTLCEYIKAYVCNESYSRTQIPTIYKYWFGDGKEELYTHLDNEKWVNCGASYGDTLMCFLAWGFSYDSITAFEGDRNAFKVLEKNVIDIKNDIDISKIRLCNSFIDADGNYKRKLQGGVTLLNADIEGNELDLIASMADVIKKERPVIALCLYHKKEDVVDIPRRINAIVDKYKFKLRKYTSWVRNTNGCHELVLYAIPEERMP